MKALVDAGLPTASQIGLAPHTIAMFGGFKIQGRIAESAMTILEDALAIQDAVKGISRDATEVKNDTFRDEDHPHGVSDEKYEHFSAMFDKRKQM